MVVLVGTPTHILIMLRQSEKITNYQNEEKNSRRLGGVSSIWLWDASPPLLQALAVHPRLKEVGFGLQFVILFTLCCATGYSCTTLVSMQLKALIVRPRLKEVAWFVYSDRSSLRYIASLDIKAQNQID